VIWGDRAEQGDAMHPLGTLHPRGSDVGGIHHMFGRGQLLSGQIIVVGLGQLSVLDGSDRGGHVCHRMLSRLAMISTRQPITVGCTD
jgi:hypothetical protein